MILISAERMRYYSGRLKDYDGGTREQFYARTLASLLRRGEFESAESLMADITRKVSIDSYFNVGAIETEMDKLAVEAAKRNCVPVLDAAIQYSNRLKTGADLHANILAEAIERRSFGSAALAAQNIGIMAEQYPFFDKSVVTTRLARLYSENGHLSRVQHQIIFYYLHKFAGGEPQELRVQVRNHKT